MVKNVNLPSPESFDDEYDNEALEEAVAKKNAKVREGVLLSNAMDGGLCG